MYKVVYISVYMIDDFLFKFRKRNSGMEEVKRKLKQQDSSAKRERRIKQHSAVWCLHYINHAQCL